MEKESKTPLTPSFSSLVVSIASAALVKIGLDPKLKEEKNLSLARYNIDLLSLLKEKTVNNLTEEESKLLDAYISDLQIEFVKRTNMEEKINPSKGTIKNPQEKKQS